MENIKLVPKYDGYVSMQFAKIFIGDFKFWFLLLSDQI